MGDELQILKKHAKGQTKHDGEVQAQGRHSVACALNIGLCVEALSFMAKAVLLFSPGFQVILSKQKF